MTENKPEMYVLRKVSGWMGRHRTITALFIAILIGGGIYAKSLMARADGVISEPLKRGSIAETVYGIGTIIATQSLQIRPGMVSTINRYYCKEGDNVKKGDKLLELNDQITYAPFSGTITSLPYKTGENVYAQGAILTLTDLSDRYVTVSLEQQGALRVKVGQKVKLSFDTFRNETYDGSVQSVYSNETGFVARIDAAGLPPRFLPGMTADVAIVIQTRDGVLLLPVAAIIDGKVWVKHGKSIPELVPIKVGIIDKSFAEVISGNITEGDRTVIKGKVGQ